MEDWSITKPEENWRVKIYFDTNILMYLFDGSFSGLNSAQEFLAQNNSFVDLISSEYALLEFLENRKKKYYKEHLRINRIDESKTLLNLLNRLLKSTGFQLKKVDSNFSWKNYFTYNIADFSYIKIFNQVKLKVEAEIEVIRNNYNVKFEDNLFNEDLFPPTKDLCLTSRISRQDCMITTSAVVNRKASRLKDIVIWTGDEDYYRAFYECTEANIVFPDNIPKIEWFRDFSTEIYGKNRSLNLANNPRTADVSLFLKFKILDYIKIKNKERFIGKTSKASNANNIIYIITEKEISFPKDGIYLTIIGKDLDFIISSRLIDSFWNDDSIMVKPDYEQLEVNSVISAKWNFAEAHSEFQDKIMLKIKGSGHYVFFSPES